MASALRRGLEKWAKNVSGWLGLSLSKEPVPEESLEDLRLAFQNRYHHFKLLLNANNRALEIMTEMEEMLQGTRPFGMSFVRSRCTQVSTNVFQIIQHLDALAPGKYAELYERFRAIQREINPHLHTARPSVSGPLVLSMDEVDKESGDLVGSKMANLGEMKRRLGVPTPEGFAITVYGARRFLEENDLQVEIDRRVQAVPSDRLDDLFALSAQIQQLIIAAPVPRDLQEAVEEQVRALKEKIGGRVRFAVRSSSLAEDLPGMSFAGQFRSELNVGEENILQAFKEVVASKYGVAAMTYRLRHGLRDEDVAMCVGCLVMVDAVAGGVLYTRNPLNIRDDVLVINAVWGLPKSVVDGSVSPDVWIASRKEPHAVLERRIGEKSVKYVCYPDEGVCRLEMAGDEGRQPCLTDAQVADLAGLALRIEAHYGGAQDIEWALDGSGRFVILQTRPFEGRSSVDRPVHVAGEDRGIPKGVEVLAEGGVTASSGAAAGACFTSSAATPMPCNFPKGPSWWSPRRCPDGRRFSGGPQPCSANREAWRVIWPMWPGNSASPLFSGFRGLWNTLSRAG